ncbi:MAG: T9SS type A sorting domain-containing protein, partial [Bacteroidales bacterium]|nr:T9SS type A sorting domain-containing protein [Bacteroidales bacterium]
AQIIQTVIGGAYSVYAADMDGDSDMDVVYGTDTRIAWQKNLDGEGSFGEQQIIYASTFGVAKALTCDINGDNKTDVLGFYPGHFSWFENPGLVSVQENQTSEFSVYPNPATDKIFLNSENPVSKIQIYNQSGELLLTMEKTSMIDISMLNPAIYILKVTDTRGNIFTVKIEKR